MELISDESSLDDSMGSRSKRSCLSKKRVSWDQIHTREFALVVGDHPMCQDGLPVSLGWDHADCNSIKLKMQQQQQQAQLQEAEQQRLLKQLSERRQSYTFPRRLSYEERRDRLQSVSNLTLDQIKNDEIDLVVRTLRESWEDVDGMGEANSNIAIGDDCLMGQNDDPLLADMMGLDDIMLPGMALEGDDGDLGDISNFEWTEDDTVKAKEESSSNNSTNNNSIPTENNAGDE
ncbi:MAG: hypothetical protein SGILL_001068 [Bacillariaceae sp.]